MDRQTLIDIIKVTEPIFLTYFAILNIWISLLVALGGLKMFFRSKELEEENIEPILKSDFLPTISVIVPCYNNQDLIVESVKSILSLTYRHKAIYIVNDGSTDESAKRVVEAFEMVPIPKFYDEKIPTQNIKCIYRSKNEEQVYFLDKEHGGKYDASNAGINAVDSSHFLILDSDTFIENSGFETLIRPFLSEENAVCVGSSIRVKNGCEREYNRVLTEKFPPSYLVGMQAMEYFRSFMSRLGWDYLNGNFVIAGAFSLFRRDFMVEAGGFCNSVGEDAEIVIRLHRILKDKKKKYKIFYVPDAIAWTEVPEKYSALSRQRTNWHLAILESLFYHKKMFFNPKYGRIGMFVFPFWFFGEALEPIIEILGYFYMIVIYMMGELHLPFVAFYLLLTLGLIFNYTFFSIVSEDLAFKKYPKIKTLLKLFFSSVIENIGYHQLSLWWRVKAFFKFFKELPRIRKEAKNIKSKLPKN